jgi:hypothetical protein
MVFDIFIINNIIGIVKQINVPIFSNGYMKKLTPPMAGDLKKEDNGLCNCGQNVRHYLKNNRDKGMKEWLKR